MKIGLPTLSRQPSITCLGLAAEAGAAARKSKTTAPIRRVSMNKPPRSGKNRAYKTGVFDDQQPGAVKRRAGSLLDHIRSEPRLQDGGNSPPPDNGALSQAAFAEAGSS